MIARHVDYMEVHVVVYADSCRSQRAVSDEASGLIGCGETFYEAAEDLADRYNEIVWH